MVEISEASLREIELALGQYRVAVERSSLEPASKNALYRHARMFVGWLRGDQPFGQGLSPESHDRGEQPRNFCAGHE